MTRAEILLEAELYEHYLLSLGIVSRKIAQMYRRQIVRHLNGMSCANPPLNHYLRYKSGAPNPTVEAKKKAAKRAEHQMSKLTPVEIPWPPPQVDHMGRELEAFAAHLELAGIMDPALELSPRRREDYERAASRYLQGNVLLDRKTGKRLYGCYATGIRRYLLWKEHSFRIERTIESIRAKYLTNIEVIEPEQEKVA